MPCWNLMLIISLENTIFVTIYQFKESLYLLLDHLIGTLDASFVFYIYIFVYRVSQKKLCSRGISN